MSAFVRPAKNFAIAVALAGGASARAAAEQAGVSERTVRRKLAKPAFRRFVANLRSQLFAAALGRMADNMTRASDALAALLDEKDPAVRLRAARAILSLGMNLRDSVDVSDRLTELENELARKQGVLP
jgi:hypothetical protein